MQVDALRGALQLGKGPEQSFNGSETDLMIEDGSGQFVFVEVIGNFVSETFFLCVALWSCCCSCSSVLPGDAMTELVLKD